MYVTLYRTVMCPAPGSLASRYALIFNPSRSMCGRGPPISASRRNNDLRQCQVSLYVYAGRLHTTAFSHPSRSVRAVHVPAVYSKFRYT